MAIRIILADDHAVVRHGVSLIIKELIPEAELFHIPDFPALLNLLQHQDAELVICDVNMPGSDSFHIIDAVRQIRDNIRILIFSAYSEELYATRYMQEGADGYLHKDADTNTIKGAIQAVLQEGKYISEAMRRKGLNRDGAADERANPLKALSNREMEVAVLLTQGLGLLEMSNSLNLHISTVSTYKSRVFEKLNISNIPELLTVFKNYASN